MGQELEARREITTDRGVTPAVISLLVLAVGAFKDGILLFKYPVPLGIDGYYYVTQLTSLETKGSFYYRTSASLFFHVANGLDRCFHNPIVSIKVAALILVATLNTGVAVFLFRIVKRSEYAICGSLVCAFLPGHLFFLVEFLKDTACFAVLIWALNLILAPGIRAFPKFLGVAALTGIALIAHGEAFLVIVSVGTLFVWITILASRHYYLPFVLQFACWVAPAVISGTFESRLPPRWQECVLRPYQIPGSSWWLPDRLLIFLFASTILLLAEAIKAKVTLLPPIAIIALGLASTCINSNPLLSQNSDTLSGRAALANYLVIAILIPTALCWGRLCRERLLMAFYLSFGAALLTLSALRPAPSLGSDPNYMMRRILLVNRLSRLSPSIISERALVVAPHGDEFLITNILHVRAQQKWPKNDEGRVYWLLDDWQLDALSPDAMPLVSQNGSWTVLIPESSLRKIWEVLSDAQKIRALRANPQLDSANY